MHAACAGLGNEVPGLTGLTSLQTLDMSRTNITRVPFEGTQLPNLHELCLTNVAHGGKWEADGWSGLNGASQLKHLMMRCAMAFLTVPGFRDGELRQPLSCPTLLKHLTMRAPWPFIYERVQVCDV